MIRNWVLLNRPKEGRILEAWAQDLERRSIRPPQLIWVPGLGSSASDGDGVIIA
jgi:hypothetical protein